MHYHYLTLEQRNALEKAMSGLPESQRQSLHQPDYGVCERCGKDIPYVRLLGQPLVRVCSACEA